MTLVHSIVNTTRACNYPSSIYFKLIPYKGRASGHHKFKTMLRNLTRTARLMLPDDANPMGNVHGKKPHLIIALHINLRP